MSIIGLRDENDHWYQSKRVNDFIRAYTIGLHETPAEIQRVTGYAVSEFLAGILPALLNLCVMQAAATTLGAAAGAVVGFGLGGVGAVPGATEGAAVGFSLSATILGWLGLGFLFVAVGKGLGEMVARLSAAVRLTWSASDHPPEQRQDDVRRAGHMLAESMGLLMLLILQAIVAWLLKRGLDKLPELIAELRSSKLGAGFAEWVEKNAAKLYNDPSLRQHRGEGSTTKVAAESEAQSPSRLAEHSKEPAPEAPKPPPGSKAQSKVKWVDENAGMSDRARSYNDSATGARSNVETKMGQAPALERTMDDGSKRLVKFDGLDGDTLVDRKLSVVTTDKAKAQALRQSEALAENGLTGRWEIPNASQAARAQKMLDEQGITNITVKVVDEPIY